MGNLLGTNLAKLKQDANLDDEELEELKMVSVFDDKKICELKMMYALCAPDAETRRTTTKLTTSRHSLYNVQDSISMILMLTES